MPNENTMKPGERMCWWCEHFEADQGSPGYSDLTPGWGPRMGCYKNHWDMDFDYGFGPKTLMECLTKAKTCEDFELSSDLQ